VSEAELTAYVADTAAAHRWLRYHTHDSRHSPSGFPDEVLLRPPRLVVAELKVGRNKPAPEQLRWLEAWAKLRDSGDTSIEVYVWTEDDLDSIAKVLA
jgi:hypothetical protein